MASATKGVGVPKLRLAWLCSPFWTIVLLLMPIAGALAQESGREWTLTYDGSTYGTYNTQQEAVSAIKSLPPPNPLYEGVWDYVDKIKETTVSESGELAVAYWMGKEQPTDPDWRYFSPATEVIEGLATEEEAVIEFIQRLNNLNPSCPAAATATPVSDWETAIPEYEGRYEQRNYASTFTTGYNTPESPCVSADFGENLFYKRRRIFCPIPYTDWKDEQQACVNEELIATITSKTEECEADKNGGGTVEADVSGTGLVGNPCNVKTGEKYETERDLDLDWVSFDRYYHSGVSNTSGNFGYGWTHSHDARLSIVGNSIGLIDGSGFHVRFSKIGAVYVAADNSGDRIVAEGNFWKLYTSDSVKVFSGRGRLLEHQFEDGSVLSYAYDDFGRVQTIAGIKGRSLLIEYDGTSDNSPHLGHYFGGRGTCQLYLHQPRPG